MATESCSCGDSEPEVEYYQPLADAMSVLSKKYALETISIIEKHEPMRFKTLEEHLRDASSKTLSDRLDQLVDKGLITRTQYEEIPPRVEYELTEDGRELRQHLEPLLDWAKTQK
ncbi:winged helix-turn-helix transcriptional regulator [Halostagnicola bangensis]